jgi:2-C-methyl-D-erythritol 2,4-cyclodiphosphate synthase
MESMRIGQGVDAHRFAPGRPLMLGGVRVEHDQGLAAHSDGDVAIHALCDALLGAAGLGDIGRLFPDTDAAYAGIDSRVLLRRVVDALNDRGLVVRNVDLTIVAQRPKLAPFVPSMVRTLACDLGCPADQVNVKATTTEHMGFTGRGEGIAALAVALLADDPSDDRKPSAATEPAPAAVRRSADKGSVLG